MRIALVPMKVRVGDYAANYKELTHRLQEAMRSGPDVVVFPEYSLTGFEEWNFESAALYASIVEKIKKLAIKHAVSIILGVLEPARKCVYNSAIMIDRTGNLRLKHRKFQEPYGFCVGDTLKTAKTELGEIAIIICGDLYNNKIATRIIRKKPDLLFVPMDYSPEYGSLSDEDIKAMAQRVMAFQVRTFVVNGSPPGGAWVFAPDGTLLSSSKGEKILVFDQ